MSVGVLVALGAAPYEPRVLGELPAGQIHIVRRCVDVADLLANAASRQATVALVSAALHGLDADVVHRLGGEGVAVVGVTAEGDSADEAALRRLGVARIASADDVASLVEAISEATESFDVVPATDDGPTPSDGGGNVRTERGTVLAVWGPMGAPGRSVVALGLGSELAALGVSTLVIDADVYGGSLAQALGMLDESSGLLAATREANIGALTPRSLAAHCRQVAPGLRVLTGLPRADRWIEASAGLVRNVLDTARVLSSATIVDCGFNLEFDEEIAYDTTAPRRNGATIEILENADTVIAVGGSDPVSLGRLVRGVQELQSVVPAQAPLVVVNRMRQGNWWPQDEIEQLLRRSLGISEVGWLPDDQSACDRALLHGKTLSEAAPQSRLVKALRTLATALAGQPAEARRSWFTLRAPSR